MASAFRAVQCRYRQRGFSLLETVIALGIATLALVGFLQLQNLATERVRAVATATRLVQVQAAAQKYVAENAGPLMAGLSARPAGPVVIPVVDLPGGAIPAGPFNLPSLQDGGYLPASFVDMNGYGQSTALLVQLIPLSPIAPAHLEAMVTTFGGAPIGDASLGIIAGKIGAAGGMVMSGRLPTQIQGTYGGWSSAVAAWNGGVEAPAPGHAQVYLSLTIPGDLAASLDRFDTGIAESNKMHASIDINNNNLNNVATIGGAAGVLNIGNALGGTNVNVNGDVTSTAITAASICLNSRCITSFTPVVSFTSTVTGNGGSVVSDLQGPADFCALSQISFSPGAGTGASSDSCAIAGTPGGTWAVMATASIDTRCTMVCYTFQ